MDEAKLNGDDPVPVTKPSLLKDIILGAMLTVSIAGNTIQAVDANKTTDEIVASLAASGKVCELPEVTDKLALTTDSIKPAYDKIYPERKIYDSTGKVIQTIKADTVQVPAGPVLAGFDENGKADYELAQVVPAGSTLRIVYVLDGIEVNSQLITPKTAEWVISARARASLHTGK